MTRLSIGFSPCPNDTYMFYPFMHGLLPSLEGILFDETIDDVETLNKLALLRLHFAWTCDPQAIRHVAKRYALERS